MNKNDDNRPARRLTVNDPDFSTPCSDCVHLSSGKDGHVCEVSGSLILDTRYGCPRGETMSDASLAPCRFCGGRCRVVGHSPQHAERAERLGRLLHPVFVCVASRGVVCLDCGAQMGGFRDDEEAVRAWNAQAASNSHEALRQCPACGGDASVRTMRYGLHTGRVVTLAAWAECGSCGLSGPVALGDGDGEAGAVGEAAERWNRRDDGAS